MKEQSQIPLAVVGMACRLPGADDLDQYWDLLIKGRSAVRTVPPERLNRDLYYDPNKGVTGKSYSEVAALVDYRPFDPHRCPIPAGLLAHSDVVQLSICQVAAEACRHAGMDPFDLPIRNTGVYIGHTMAGELSGELTYSTCVEGAAKLLRELKDFDRLTGAPVDEVIAEVVRLIRSRLPRRGRDGNPVLLASTAAAIIAEALQLTGPALIVDAACSSSLQCLALASRALRQERIDMAIVGGASYVGPSTLVLFSHAQSISTGASCPFDAAADGLIAGEGQAAVVLKTLPRALADGDRIWCVIRGIGVSSDGRGKSLWAPMREGQVEAIRRAYAGGLEMKRLQFVEAHATSTQAGDVTEMKALAEVLSECLPAGVKIPVGGVKANIGHTLETAGLAGLIKVVLAMEHRTIPRQINVSHLNPEIDWEHAPFFVPTENLQWPAHEDGHPRRAAVNSFGVGGLNVHVVADEFAAEAERRWVAASAPTAARAATAVRRPADDGVAIIGMGCIFPGARTLDAFWDLLISGRDPKVEMPPDRRDNPIGCHSGSRGPWQTSSPLGGFVTDYEYDWRKHKVPPKQIARADPLQFMILDATDAALCDAGYDKRPYDKGRVGVVVGTIFGGDFAAGLQIAVRLPEFRQTLVENLRRRGVPEQTIEGLADRYAKLLHERVPALLDETGSFTPSTLASRITKSFDLMGGALSMDAGSCSSLAAVSAGVDWVLSGECDMVICAGGQRSMGLPVYERSAMAGYLAEGRPKSPFDASFQGGVPGEGVGVVVLKRLADTRRDGDRVRGIVRGCGAGYSSAMGDASGTALGEAVGTAIARSLEQAGASAEDVAVLETAAVSSPAHADGEWRAIGETLGAEGRQSPLLLGSTSAQIGVTQGASGMASLIKATLEIEHREVPATFGLDEPAGRLSEYVEAAVLPLERQRIAVTNPEGRVLAGVSCLEITGLAQHLIVERATPVPASEITPGRPAAGAVVAASKRSGAAREWPGLKSDFRIVCVGGPSLETVVESVTALAAAPEPAFRRAASARFGPADRVRAAIVARDPAELAEKAQLAATGLGKPECRALLEGKGVFLGYLPEERPRMAFLFTGQGSQYAGMLRRLVDEFPPAAEAMTEIDGVLARLGHPTFADIAWEQGELLGTDVWRTQLSLLAAETILYRSLAALGLRPDCIGGHSYGELPALMAAGGWTFEGAVRGTQARCRVVEQCRGGQGGLLSVAASMAEVEQFCRDSGGRVHVANWNAPKQTVVGGDREALTEFEKRVRDAGIDTRLLTVPRPFHTPLMEEVKEPFRRALEEIPIHPPQVPMISSVTNRYVADPDEIRDNLACQMAVNVRYVDLIERLVREGVAALVEVGPNQVLTGLHRKILEGRPVAMVASDNRKAGGVEQLLYVLACVETAGVLDDPASWSERGAASVAGRTDQRQAAGLSDPAPQPGPAPQAKAAPSSPAVPLPGAEAHGKASKRGPLVIRLAGTPYEMGLAHGRRHGEAIRTILRKYVDQPGLSTEDAARTDAALAQVDALFGPEDLEELRGIAEGAGVSTAAIIAHNLRLSPDQGAGCLHFAIAARANPAAGLVHAANDDVPVSLLLKNCLERNIQVRFPKGGIPHVTFSIAGQMAAGNGINAKGLAVTSAALLDRAGATLVRARVHSSIVKRVLQEAEDIDAAIEVLRRTPGCGAWGICLSHFPTDQICYVEYDGETVVAGPRQDRFCGTNHALLLPAGAQMPAHSQHRLARLEQLVAAGSSGGMAVPQVQAALRDQYDVARGRQTRFPTMNTVRRVDNQLSIVMQPGEGKVWVTQGPAHTGQASQNGKGDAYYGLDLRELFAVAAVKPEPAGARPAEAQALSSAAYGRALSTGRSRSRGGTAGRFCHRFVLRMVEGEVPAGTPEHPRFLGPALLVGRNKLSAALSQRIRACGGKTVELPISDDPDATLAELERLWKQSPLPHLFLLTPYDEDAVLRLDTEGWNRRRARGVVTPYLVCQRWFQLASAAGLIHRASAVVAADLGGDFGFSGPIRNAESGALAGLLKGWRIEVYHRTKSDFAVKIVDRSPSQSLEDLAAAMLRELAIGGSEVEVAYQGTRRLLARVLIVPAEDLPRVDLPRGGTWVVTGGARGVTAVAACAIGRQFGLKLHLLGSSPVPEVDPAWKDLSPEQLRELRATVMKQSVARREVPAEAWKRVEKAIEIDRNLRTFREAGVEATYHSCDVTDRAALAAMLDRIRSKDGPIEGILHGAGFERATRFDKKSRDVVEKTLAAKVDAAAALLELTQADPLRYFVAFGSVSGRFGGLGQTDYCMANEMLGKLVGWHRRQHPDCKAMTFHWHMWDEVGMAARPEASYLRDLPSCHLMPTREGAEHVIEELRAGLPEREIAISEWDYCKLFFPIDDWLAPASADDDDKTSPVASAPSAVPAEVPRVAKPVEDTASSSQPSAAPLDSPGSVARVAQRYVLRTVETSLPSASQAGRRPLAGSALVLGDNGDARALQQQLERHGTTVHTIDVGEGSEAALAQLERVWASQSPRHLFVLTPRDADASAINDRQAWLRRVEAGILTPCLVCQKWLQLLAPTPDSEAATLTLVASLGGHFGWSGEVTAPEGGALAGLFKSIRAEAQVNRWQGLRVRIVDAAAGEPPALLATSILQELAGDAEAAEVAFVGEKRRTVEIVSQPADRLPRHEVPRGGTWVIVGGARGITAAVALELGRRYGLKLHLLGRTPLPALPDQWRDLSPAGEAELKRSLVSQALAQGKPPGDAWDHVQRELEIDRNLRAMAAAGVKATYHACDVSDWDQVARTLDSLRGSDGPIEGIVHGGGSLNRFVQFAKVRRSEFAAALGVKLGGAMALMSLTRNDPLKYWIGFGSISGRFGSNAGTDYSLGCEGLAKLVDWFRGQRPECRAACFHWHAWGDVGMMLDPRNYGTVQVMKVALMPAAEGVAHVIEELEAGLPESEVLVADLPNVMASLPSAKASGVTISTGEAASPAASPPRTAPRRPLLDSVAQHVPGSRIDCEMRLDPAADPFLVQHRFRGRPMLPLVIGLEAMAEAAAALDEGPPAPVGLRDVEVLNALRFLTDSPQTARVVAERTQQGVACRLTTDFYNRRGQLVHKDRPHFRATAEHVPDPSSAPTLSLPASLVWEDVAYPEGELVIYHGPALRCLTKMEGCEDGTWYGKITAGATGDLIGTHRQGDFLLPLAALDASFFACGIFIWYVIDRKLVSIPEGVGRLRPWRAARPGEECIVELRLKSWEKQRGSFNFVLYGEDGQAILEVEDYRSINAAGGPQ